MALSHLRWLVRPPPGPRADVVAAAMVVAGAGSHATQHYPDGAISHTACGPVSHRGNDPPFSLVLRELLVLAAALAHPHTLLTPLSFSPLCLPPTCRRPCVVAACEACQKAIEKTRGKLVVKEAARAVSERDDRLLAEKLEQLESANREVDGDAESGEEEDEGMGDIDVEAGPALLDVSLPTPMA